MWSIKQTSLCFLHLCKNKADRKCNQDIVQVQEEDMKGHVIQVYLNHWQQEDERNEETEGGREWEGMKERLSGKDKASPPPWRSVGATEKLLLSRVRCNLLMPLLPVPHRWTHMHKHTRSHTDAHREGQERLQVQVFTCNNTQSHRPLVDDPENNHNTH